MPKPRIDSNSFHAHSFSNTAGSHLIRDRHLVIDRHGIPHILMLPVVFGKSLFRAVSIFLILLINPVWLIHSVVGVKYHEDRIEHRLVMNAPTHELVHQNVITVQHVLISLKQIFRIMSANAIITPTPEIERSRTILNIFTQILSKDVKVTILMNCKRVVEVNIIVQKILPPVNLAVNESRVHIMIHIDNFLGFEIAGLFNKSRNQAIKSGFHFPEYYPKPTCVVEHVIRIAEHYIIRCRIIKACISGSRYSTMRSLMVFNIIWIPTKEQVRQEHITTVIADNYSYLLHRNILLNGDTVQKRF